MLGVAPDTNEDEIKRASHKVARKYHPDINKDARMEAKFKEVNEACEVWLFRGHGLDSHARLDISIEDAFEGASRNPHLRMPVFGPDGRANFTDRKLAVRIPKGVVWGQYIRLAGLGTPSLNGGEVGDLFIEIAFTPHPVYRPEGRDLHLDLPVAPWEAKL